ncbi:MAG: MlaD family protein [Spirochaetota bacterium]
MVRVRNEIAVGILFFIGMAILGYFTIIMKDEIIDTRSYSMMSAEFPFINGLQKGERVKMFGVDVGSVTKITLNGRKVLVVFKIYEDTLFYENYYVTIRSESIMMGKYLSIDPGTAMTGDTANAVIDKTLPLSGIAPSDMMALAEDILAENRSDIRSSVSNIKIISSDLKDVTGKINRGEGTLGKLINEDQTKEAGQLMKEVRDTVEDAREQAPVTSFLRAIITFL